MALLLGTDQLCLAFLTIRPIKLFAEGMQQPRRQITHLAVNTERTQAASRAIYAHKL